MAHDGRLGFDPEKLDASIRRGLDNPMPRDLKEAVENEIEPQTMNSYQDHGDVMDCINIAYPLIRDYLREHPEALGGKP